MVWFCAVRSEGIWSKMRYRCKEILDNALVLPYLCSDSDMPSTQPVEWHRKRHRDSGPHVLLRLGGCSLVSMHGVVVSERLPKDQSSHREDVRRL